MAERPTSDNHQPENTRPTGWHRRPGARPTPQSYTHLPSGEPVNLQPDIDAQLQYWCDLYGADPYGFALQMFEWGKPYSILAKRERPYDFQCEILEDMTNSLAQDPSIYRLAIAAGRGPGKTALLSMIYLWHIMMHRFSRTNLLSMTGDALDQRIWAEIGLWFELCKARPYFKRYRGGKIVHHYHDTWFGAYQLWGINRVQALFGSHAPHLGFFVDEACGVPNEVLEAIESGFTDEHVIAVYISNPTRLRSRFRQYFPGGSLHHLWHTWQIDSRTTERHNPARVQELLDEGGGDEDDPRFRVHVRGEFPLMDEEQYITDAIIARAHERYMNYPSRLPEGAPEGDFANHEPVVIGVDVARKGANKTVFLVRQGARILAKRVYAMKLTDETAKLLQDLIHEYRHWKPQVYIDIVGYGAGTFDLCEGYDKEWGARLHEVNSSQPAIGSHAERFENRRMELFDFVREWVRFEGRLNPKDGVLARQLTAPMAFVNERHGLLQLESKVDMESRGVESPDEADALSYTFGGVLKPRAFGGVIPLRY